MPEILKNGFKLGPVLVKPTNNALTVGEITSQVEPKTMAVLLVLARAGNETVSRDDIITKVWPRGHVTDDVLNRCISQLRTALGDSPKNPEYIITIPRKGYRLAKPVEPHTQFSQANTLVLPFQNLSSSNELYITDGLTELLIARLSIALDQPVISRTTAMTFRDTDKDLVSIVQQLGVRWVIEGSLLQIGNQIQIIVQLIDANTDTHIWAETWTRPIDDTLSVLNEISRLVATQVRAQLQPASSSFMLEVSLPPDLLREYLLGIQLISKRTQESLRRSISCFEKVLSVYPDHASSLSGMARSHVLMGHYGALPSSTWFENGRQFALQALEIDPKQVDAMCDLAAVNFHYDWEFNRAEETIENALKINPHLEMGLILAANINLVNKRYERTMECIDKAILIDPLNVGVLMNAGDQLILQQRYGEAIDSLKTALRISPALYPACLRLSLAYAYSGDKEESINCLMNVKEMDVNPSLYYEYLAIAEGVIGNQENARKAAQQLENMAHSGTILPWSLARAWSSAGDEGKAIEYLFAAFESRSSSMPFLAATPVLSPIRQHPDVQRLMSLVGVSE